MYYRMREGVEPRGYKGLPFALTDLYNGQTKFFDREVFSFLLKCDGTYDMDPSQLSKQAERRIEDLLEKGILEARVEKKYCPVPGYRQYPNYYRESAHWSITGHCNYKCRHCLMSAPEGKFPHPTFEQLLRIADQLAECGVMNVSLTGGEPLIRKDFMQLVDALTERHILIGTIFTNGKLVTRELLEGLKERGIRCEFQMSFDGTQGWHDWMRGIEGAGKDVENAIKLCIEYGFPVSCAMCLSKNSMGTLRESVNYLAGLGVYSLKVNKASPEGDWKNFPEYFLSDQELFQVFLNYIPQYFEDGCPLSLQLDAFFLHQKGAEDWYNGFERDENFTPEMCLLCGCTKKNFFIGADGTVAPCMSMNGNPVAEQFENIFEKDLKEILTDSRLIWAGNLKFSDMIEHNRECAECKYKDRCGGGCRARATGELYADYLVTESLTCEFFKGEWSDKLRKAADPALEEYLNRNKN